MASEQLDEKAIFNIARQIKLPEARTEYLHQVCGADGNLLQRVNTLLQAYEEQASFLESPPAAGFIPTQAQSAAETPGSQIGPYKLLQQIGEGGMGTVFMAEQSHPVQRKVALKVIKAGMDSGQVIARFEAERQALAMMDHVNIARVLDAGATQSRRPYFVMELVHGVPITKYCDDNHLTPRQRLELFVPVCQAIQHAHQKGIIHRDIKPSNVMVTLYDDKPVPKVIDFGVAKATEQKLTERTLFTQYGTMVGTLEYMSPEQAEMSALGVDTRSDLYSLGVLLYELLTGSTPLTHKRMNEGAYAEILRMIKEVEPPKPSTRLSDSGEALASISANRHMEPAKLAKLVRGELDWIVMKTLEKDRSRRYETANGLAMDVQRYLADEPVLACPPSAGYRLRKFARRNRLAMMTTALVALALVAGTVVSAWQAIRATRARHDAEVARTDADQRRKEAIANLQKAREAGEEFFTRVSENRLLEEPGLQSLRQELLEAGVAYYEGLAAGKSEDPQAQADMIVSRLRLVQIYFQTLSRDQHILALEKGIEVVEEFLRAHPDATSEHLKLAGFFHGGRGVGSGRDQPLSDRDRALRAYEQATALWEKLVERYPTVTGFQSDLSKFYDLQGNVQVQVGQRAEALGTRQKVRELREQIVRTNPGVYEHVAELGYAYQALAVLLEVSDPEAAEALYRQSLSIQKDAPDIVTYQDFLATHRASFGRFLANRKRPEEAIQFLEESLGIWDKLAAAFPHESKYAPRAERVRREIHNVRQGTSGTGQVKPAEESPAQQQAAALLRGLNRDGDAYRAASEPQKAEHSYRLAITRFKALPPELSTVSGCREALILAYVRLGDLFSANEPPEGAEQAYLDALEVAQELAADFPGVPNYRSRLANLHRALAQLYSRVGRAQEAEQACRRAIDLLAALTAEFPQAEAHWYNLGLVHARLGQWDQAVAGYTKAVELKPDYWEAWHDRGWAHGNLGQWDKAVADQTKAIELKPGFAMAWHGRGYAHFNLGQWDKAVAGYTKAIELKPDLEDAWRGRGWARANLGQWDKAVADHTKAIELKPGSGHAWHLRGWAHAQLGQSDKAVADQTKALELMPKHWWTWWRRGQAYSALGQWDQAIPDYAKAIELGATDSDVWLSKAAAHLSLQQWDLARADYAKAIELNAVHLPGAVERFKAAGRSQGAEKLARQAVADAEKLTAEFPLAETHWHHLGFVHAHLGQWDQAIAGYSKAIELKPDYWEAWTHRGYAHVVLGQWNQAVADNTKAIELKSDSWYGWHGRGWAHANLAQWDKAVADQTKALELMPTHWWTWYRRGQGYSALEQWDQAIPDYAKAIELGATNADVWLSKAAAHASLQQWDQALVDYTKAIELNAGHLPAAIERFKAAGRSQEAEQLGRQAVAAAEKLTAEFPQAETRWYDLGLVHAQLAQWDQVVAGHTKAIELKPDFGDAWHMRGYAHAQLGQWDKAVADHTKAIELKPDYWEAWYNRGGAHANLGQWDQAVTDQTKALELLPKHWWTWWRRGQAYRALEQWDKAAADLAKAAELAPKQAELWYELGLVQSMLGQRDQAVASQTKAIELSNSADAWHNRGFQYANLGQWDKAIADQTKAAELSPTDWRIWWRRGQAYTALKQWDQAIPDYAKAIELGATEADVWPSKAAAHASLQQWDQARGDYAKAIELNADHLPGAVERLKAAGGSEEAEKLVLQAVANAEKLTAEFPQAEAHWYSLGRTHAHLGQWERAVAGYTKAIKLKPDYWQAWHNRGWAQCQLGQWHQALADQTKTIELKPDYANAWHGRGFVHVNLRQWDQAVADETKAIELKPDYGDARYHLVHAHVNLAKLLAAANRVPEAQQHIERAISLRPDDAGLLNNLAWHLVASADGQRHAWPLARTATDAAKKAVELAPAKGSFWNTLGVAHYRAGDWKAAIEALENSMRLLPDKQESFNTFFLAMAHWQLGEKDKARESYDQAVAWMEKNAKDNEELRRFRVEAEELMKKE